MTLYSVQPRDRIFVKGYGFLPFAKNIDKNIGKNISESLNSKYSQKCLDHAKQSATDALKLLRKGSFKKQWKQTVISLEIKFLIKLQEKIYISKTKTKNYWWSKVKERLI